MSSLEQKKIKNEPFDEDMNSSKSSIAISDENIAQSKYIKINTTNILTFDDATTESRTELNNILPLNNEVSHEFFEVKDTRTSIDETRKPTIIHPSATSHPLIHLESKNVKTEPVVKNNFYSPPINITSGRSLLKSNLQFNDFPTTELNSVSKPPSANEINEIAKKSFPVATDLKSMVSNCTSDLSIQNSSNTMFISNIPTAEMATSNDSVLLIPLNMYIRNQEGNYCYAKTDYLLSNSNTPVSSDAFLPCVHIPTNAVAATDANSFSVAQIDRSIRDTNTNCFSDSSYVPLPSNHITKHSESEDNERNSNYSNDDQAGGSNSSITKFQETLEKPYIHVRSCTETDYLSKGSNSSCVLPFNHNSNLEANRTAANNSFANQMNGSNCGVNVDNEFSSSFLNNYTPNYSSVEEGGLNTNNSKDAQTSNKSNSTITKVPQTLADMHTYIRGQQDHGKAETDYLLATNKSSVSSSDSDLPHILESIATITYASSHSSNQINRSVVHSDTYHSSSKDSDSTCVPGDGIPKCSAIECFETNTNYSKNVQVGRSNYSTAEDGQSLADLLDPLNKYFVGNKCLLCGFISKDKKNSGRRHLAIHLKTRNFKCNICGKCFKTPDTLYSHRDFIHNTIKEFVCNDCGQKFSKKCSLRDHIITSHNCPKKHVCSICDKQFVRLRYLKEHLRIHTGEKPYKCTVCDKAFRTNKALKTHSAQHNPEKRIICPVCNKSYNKKMFLKDHMNTHNDSPSYKCDVCDKMFNFKSNLVQHKLVHSDTRKHSCETCGMKFKLPHHLKSHILTHESK